MFFGFDKRQISSSERPCQDRGNGSPFCAPTTSDTWYNGSSYEFVWNYNYPFYVTTDRLNLFLYYKHNYAYEAVKNWTDIDRSQGHLTVQVDDSWFPAGPEPTDKSWTYYGLYLPAGIDPAAELVNPDSQYPRPFNFTVVQPGTNQRGIAGQQARNASMRQLPGWAAILIALGTFAVAASIATCIAYVLLKRRLMQQALARRAMRTSYGYDDMQQQQQSLNEQFTTTTQHPSYDLQHCHPMSQGRPDTGSSIYSTTPIVQHSNVQPRSSLTMQQQPQEQQQTGRLAESTFMWMVQPTPAIENEQSRREFGDSLLAQQLSEDQGALMRHAERRPVTVHCIAQADQAAVAVEETQHPS